jgi:hypothetical protein
MPAKWRLYAFCKEMVAHESGLISFVTFLMYICRSNLTYGVV